jgi:hypothetical protein
MSENYSWRITVCVLHCTGKLLIVNYRKNTVGTVHAEYCSCRSLFTRSRWVDRFVWLLFMHRYCSCTGTDIVHVNSVWFPVAIISSVESKSDGLYTTKHCSCITWTVHSDVASWGDAMSFGHYICRDFFHIFCKLAPNWFKQLCKIF